jgi:hypothetical protein
VPDDRVSREAVASDEVTDSLAWSSKQQRRRGGRGLLLVVRSMSHACRFEMLANATLSMSMVLPANGPWTLPIEGFEVLQITFAYPIDVVTYGDGGVSATIRFEARFDFADDDGVHAMDAARQSWDELALLLALRHDRITEAVATEDDAQVRIAFASGRLLTAGPDPHYENWQVTGPGFQLISTPGGGVAHFSNGGGTTPEP